MPYTRYRYSGYSSYFPPGVKWLLIVNTGLFLLYFFVEQFTNLGEVFRLFAVSPLLVLKYGFVWQLFTYMFLHGGLWHILFNMFALWMFGVDLERDWGTRRFLQYYFLCGIGAGICDVLLNAAVGNWYVRTIGASGAIYGLLLAFGVLYPDRIVLFSFLFPIKAKYFVMILGAIEFLSSISGANNGVSNVAHLGGMLFGYVYLKAGLSRIRFDPLAVARGAWHQWKLQRARRKFQVYMRKHRKDQDRWVH